MVTLRNNWAMTDINKEHLWILLFLIVRIDKSHLCTSGNCWGNTATFAHFPRWNRTTQWCYWLSLKSFVSLFALFTNIYFHCFNSFCILILRGRGELAWQKQSPNNQADTTHWLLLDLLYGLKDWSPTKSSHWYKSYYISSLLSLLHLHHWHYCGRCRVYQQQLEPFCSSFNCWHFNFLTRQPQQFLFCLGRSF